MLEQNQSNVLNSQNTTFVRPAFSAFDADLPPLAVHFNNVRTPFQSLSSYSLVLRLGLYPKMVSLYRTFNNLKRGGWKQFYRNLW